MNDPKIIVALDCPKLFYLSLFEELDPSLCRIKIGKSLFTRHGLPIVQSAQNYGFDVFLDLKYHDIPNTVADAVEAAADLGVWMMNLHASGGKKMMEAARERLDKNSHKPILIAVTILTSLTNDDLIEMGFAQASGDLMHRVHTLTSHAYDAGMDGVVCSPNEVGALCTIAKYRDEKFVRVVPGIRPAGTSVDDQARIATSKAALDAGATYIVIGRPITEQDDAGHALRQIVNSIT